MTAINWKTGVNGSWDTAADWTGGVVPAGGNDVVIAAAGSYIIQMVNAESVASLVLNAAGAQINDTSGQVFSVGSSMTIMAGTFALSSGSQITATGILREAAGGTLTGGGGNNQVTAGTITLAGRTQVTSGILGLNGGGTLGGTLSGAGTLELGAGTFALAGGIAEASTLNVLVNGGGLSVGSASGFASSLQLIQSGTLSIAKAATLNLLNGLTIGQALLNDGTNVISGPGTLSTTGATEITASTQPELTLAGGLTWSNTGVVDVDGSGGMAGGSKIVNAAGAHFNFTSDATTLTSDGNAANLFTNAGTITKTSATNNSQSEIDSALNNTGLIEIDAGTLTLAGGGSIAGTVSGIGTLLLNAGAFAIGAASGNGHVVLGSGASIGFAATELVTTPFTFDYGVGVSVAAGATATLSGGINIGDVTGGAIISGPGTLATTGVVTINDVGNTTLLELRNGVKWSNGGTVNDAGAGYIGTPGSGGGDTCTVLNSGTFNFIGDDASLNLYLASGGNPSAAFTNTGTLAKTSGTGTSTIGATINSTGAVNVASGELALADGGFLGGTLAGAGTLALTNGAFTTSGISGAGTLLLTQTGSAAATLTATATGTITAALAADHNTTLAVAGAKTLTLAGPVAIGDSTGGLTLSGPGTIVTTGTTTVADLGGTIAFQVQNGITWANKGTVNDAGAGLIGTPGSSGADTCTILNSAVFNLAGADSSVSLNGSSGGAPAAVFNNQGLLEKTGTGTGTIGAPVALTNSGTIEVAGGTLALLGGVGGTGIIKIDTGATLDLGSLPASQSVTFTGGAGATLKLEAPVSATLTKFTAGDRLDLAGITVIKVANAGGTLTVTTSSGVLTYVSAGLTGQVATFASDKNGGSFVSLYRAALASHTPEPLAFGNHHVGDKGVSLGLTVANIAAADGYSEKLNASLGAATAGFTAAGTVSALAAGASNSTSLTVTFDTSTAGAKAGTASLALATNGAGVDGRGAVALAAQTVNLIGSVYNYAAASLASSTVTLANQHVGGGASAHLILTNTAAAGGFSEGLDAFFTGTSGMAFAGGSTGLIAAGAGNATALSLGLSPAAAGVATGTGVLTYVSDGAGTSGLGTTTLGTQSVSVTGNFYNLASGTPGRGTIAFGNHHVGDTVAAQILSLTNSAAAGAYSEALDASLAATGALSAAGTINGLAAGQTDTTALSIGETAKAAGLIAGTVVLGLVSDGTGIDGLGTTTLTGETLTVTGANYNLAEAQAATTINLGVVHAATAASAAITLTNSAAAGGFSEALDAGFGASASVLSPGGTITGLAAGATDGSTLSITLDDAASGAFSGAVQLLFTSDGAGIDGLGTTSLGSQAVTVSATVDNYALAAFEDPSGPALTGTSTSETLNLGSIVQGGAALTATIGALNAQAGLSDLLGGTLTSAGGAGYINSGLGSFSGLAAGQDEHAQTVSLATGTTGTFTETIVLSSYGTNASGYNGALGNETLTITGTVTASSYTTYTLTAGPNTITGADGRSDIFIAAAGGLNSYDHLIGGNGANTLTLVGAGLFDIGAAHLANIPIILAREGQAASGTLAATRQTVLLSDSVSQSLTVQAAAAAAGNASPVGISIYNDTGSNIVALAAGSDQVFGGTGTLAVALGGSANKITAGGGLLLVHGTAAQAAASVVGTTAGQTTLEVTTGGTVMLNAADTYVSVKLDAAGTLKLGALGFITATGSAGADTLIAGGANQTLTGGAGLDTLAGAAVGGDIFADTAAGLNGDRIMNWTTGDGIDLQDIVAANLHALTFASGRLGVTDGTASATITFTGTVALSNFTIIGSDGHGGTLLRYHG